MRSKEEDAGRQVEAGGGILSAAAGPPAQRRKRRGRPTGFDCLTGAMAMGGCPHWEEENVEGEPAGPRRHFHILGLYLVQLGYLLCHRRVVGWYFVLGAGAGGCAALHARVDVP